MALDQPAFAPALRVVEYIRKSTDMQQHSLANQHDYIETYASEHGMRVVRTYSDPARSGIGLKGRGGLRNLLKDVLSAARDFDAVLVYDVSRWGRFQDTDEGAHYEFICRQAGVPIIYCAEPFSDTSPISSIAKSVKRVMAAEFSRELGEKIKASQLRVARMGFHAAGPVPFGYRRVVIATDGTTKRTLRPFEQKRFLSDRIGLALGPAQEVNLIRRVFRLFVKYELSPRAIARRLNSEGIRSTRGRMWNERSISRLMRQTVYVGFKFYNQNSQRLGARATPNPREDWVPMFVRPIVSKELFDAAIKRLNMQRCARSSQAELVEQLRRVGECAGGVLTDGILMRSTSKSTLQNYHRRFGSTVLLFDQMGFEVDQSHLERARRDARARSLNDELVGDAIAAVRAAGHECIRRSGRYARAYQHFKTNGKAVSVTCKRMPRISVMANRPSVKFALRKVDFALIARANHGGSRIFDYVVFDVTRHRGWRFETRDTAFSAVVSLLRGDEIHAEKVVFDRWQPRLPLLRPSPKLTVVEE